MIEDLGMFGNLIHEVKRKSFGDFISYLDVCPADVGYILPSRTVKIQTSLLLQYCSIMINFDLIYEVKRHLVKKIESCMSLIKISLVQKDHKSFNLGTLSAL